MKSFIHTLFAGILLFFTFCANAQNTNDQLAINWLQYLSDDSQKGRFTGSPEHLKLGDSIAHYFQQTGLKPYPLINGYQQPVEINYGKNKIMSYNIIGWIPGTTMPDELILITAHYDHLGTSSTNPNLAFNQGQQVILKDTIYNGANDNATGTAAVLTLADYFVKHPPKKSLLFVCFTGEELGLMGSWPLVYLLKDISVQAVVNIEMIGRSISKKIKAPVLTGYEYSDLGAILNLSLEKQNPALYGHKYIAPDPYYTHKLFYRSDNYSFARVGIPAHTILTTPPNDKYYHHVKDDFKSIDLPHFTQTIETIKNSLLYLVNEKVIPRKINTLLLPEK